jgi:hypothetical protein
MHGWLSTTANKLNCSKQFWWYNLATIQLIFAIKQGLIIVSDNLQNRAVPADVQGRQWPDHLLVFFFFFFFTCISGNVDQCVLAPDSTSLSCHLRRHGDGIKISIQRYYRKF